MNWNQLLREAVETEISTTVFAAFNANIDVVVKVKPQDVKNMWAEYGDEVEKLDVDPTTISPIKEPSHFIALLKECLAAGKSYYDVVDISLTDWFYEVFPEKTEAMGGQAGIIANQMAALGADARVYNPVLSPKQAAVYDQRVKFPVVENSTLSWKVIREAVNETWTKVNFIFEYAKGDAFQFGAETVNSPRANRIILGTRNPKAAMGFDSEIEPFLPEVGSAADVAFMAGYHHGQIAGRAETLDEFIALSTRQRNLLKKDNPNLRLHLEYVPMKAEEDEKQLLASLVPQFDSFGINENEIKKVLAEFGHPDLAEEIAHNERAFSLYQGTLALLRTLRPKRIQLHNLGYYILVLAKPYPVEPEKVRQACLFASSVNAVKAKKGGAVPRKDVPAMAEVALSDIGFNQLKEFAREAKQKGYDVPESFADEGILELDDHILVMVPAHVIPNPVSTVGMGDTVSSCSFAAEVSLAK